MKNPGGETEPDAIFECAYKQIDADLQDVAGSITTDADGNVYLAGQVRAALGDQTALGDADGVLQKYDPTGALGQGEQQVVFKAGDVDLATLTVDPPSSQIEGQACDHQALTLGSRLGPPEQRPNPRQKLPWTERLGQVVVSARPDVPLINSA